MKLIILIAILPFIYSLNNGLGLTPPMGWNSWNHFGCGINEGLIQQTADAIVSTGLAAAGYKYVNLDDCWQLSRDNVTLEIQPDPQAFPSGIKALADYVHNKGLKFGLYSDAGQNTCQGRPGGLFHEKIDATTYASWGVDYLKYDNCNNLKLPAKYRYSRMRDALNASGRAIYYSMCEWGQNQPWTWANDFANSWRTTGDIQDKWDSVMSILSQQAPITKYGAKGGWNDPDMLEVGNGGMTNVEYQSHFALWAFLKAPLIIGCDVTKISNATLSILTNNEIIAINQDPLGIPAGQIYSNGSSQIWGGKISDGYAAVLLNTGASTANITLTYNLLGITGQYYARDLIGHQNLGAYTNSVSAQVPSHGVAAIKLTVNPPSTQQISH